MKLTKNKAGIYVATIRTDHGRRTITTGCTVLSQAKEVLKEANVEKLEMAAKAAKLQRSVINQLLVGRKVTIESIIPEYLEWKQRTCKSSRHASNYADFVRRWARDMRILQMPPSVVKQRHVDEWINDPEDPSKLSTRKLRLSSLKDFFKFCVGEGYSLSNPASLIPIDYSILTHQQKEKRQLNPFTNDEMDYLLAHTRDFWHWAIAIARWTGLRIGDIAKLEWDTMKVADRMIVWTDKTNTRVNLPIPDRLAKILEKIPRLHDRWVFPEAAEVALDDKRRAELHNSFRRILIKLGLEGHVFHDLRSTKASVDAEEGRDIAAIAKDLGHKSTATTAIYIRKRRDPIVEEELETAAH